MIQKLIVIVIAILCISLQSIAQPNQVTITDENTDQTLDKANKQPEGLIPVENTETKTQARTKHSLSYEVLGRELTDREQESYRNTLSKEDLKNILSGEQKLAIVRALITVGEKDSIKDVLGIYSISKLQTYSELVDYFNGMIEKYGSVKTGIEDEYVYNIKDNRRAFEKAASKAYETVFGIPEDKQNKDQIFSFLTQSNALTYSKMIQALMQTITPDIKKQILFNALDQIGRPDLKTNDKFVTKMLEQQFTYKNLTELLKELKQTAPLPQKNLQKK
ncbi:MAG: hypothetical protein A3I68_03780 [Candidatus Melainabacteria bacterium RIFCSPLOWO2_02_FULL_35_15]|nr:MAG: hypothetical protein A3F80_04095 [Candidatus Melainabacteria bacterium RIFCSPLOWO2_12_FULL_35_11]OGI14718.1 MAG: hypothetical protein A3I68_03780 [Candidatus Melainabacteria bacterium RIFCSPLOWO2_02_FULL_35_15]